MPTAPSSAYYFHVPGFGSHAQRGAASLRGIGVDVMVSEERSIGTLVSDENRGPQLSAILRQPFRRSVNRGLSALSDWRAAIVLRPEA